MLWPSHSQGSIFYFNGHQSQHGSRQIVITNISTTIRIRIAMEAIGLDFIGPELGIENDICFREFKLLILQ
jgi:hypothetical protein